MNQTKMANTIGVELVFIPAIGLGHIMSTVEIAKQLVDRDQRLSVTVLVIKPFSGSEITSYVESLTNDDTERIRFVELPHDETVIPKLDPKAPMTFLNDYMNSHKKYVRDVVGEMTKRPGSGRIAGFVIDVFCTGMMDVADEFGVPTYVFFTSNAAFLGFNLCIQTLCENGNQGVAEFCDPDAEFVVTSFVNPVPTKVFPMVYQTKDGLDFLQSCSRKMKEAKGILVNTFLEFETHAIESFSSLENGFPTVYPVGPVLNLDGVAAKPQDSDIIGWLDGQQPSSVVFLCFGSMGTFGETQVKEIAHALERSGRPFVWSLRQPPPTPEQGIDVRDYGDPGVVLPEGFLERTLGVGRVIGWAPQTTLLAHPAVGGFVSHCGWNSVLESLWFGVPLATWPMYAEQQLNAFELVVELGLAVEITLDYKKDVFAPDVGDTVVVTADEIERGIRQLMEDIEVRGKVKEMSRKSRAAVAKDGSSFTSIGHLIHELLSNI